MHERERTRPQFERLEQRVLLSADLAPMADLGPSDYGPTLFQQSLLADSLLFDQDRYDHKRSSVSASGGKPTQQLSSAVRSAEPIFVLQNKASSVSSQTKPIRDLAETTKPIEPPVTSMPTTEESSSPFDDLFGSLEDFYEEIDLPESGEEVFGGDGDSDGGDDVTQNGDVDLSIEISPTIFEANMGDWIDIAWTVTNIGEGDALGNGWHDWVVYSQDQTPDDSDIYLTSQWSGSQGLQVGDSYDVFRSAQLSEDITQDGYLIFFTDRWDRIDELDGINNYTVVEFDLLDAQEEEDDSGDDSGGDTAGGGGDDDSGDDTNGDGGEDGAGDNTGGDEEDGDSGEGDGSGGDEEDRGGELINYVISEEQQQKLIDGLGTFVSFIEELQGSDLFIGPLAGLGEWVDTNADGVLEMSQFALGAITNPEQLLSDYIQSPIVDYFDTGSVDTDGLIDALTNFDDPGASLNFSWDELLGGLDELANEYRVDLQLSAIRTVEIPIVLPADVLSTGFDFGGELSLEGGITFAADFSLGVDLTDGIPDAEAFFIRVNSMTAQANIGVVGLNLDASFNIVDVTITGGALTVDAGLDLQFQNPDGDAAGNITGSELMSALGGSTQDITAQVATSHSFDSTLPVTVTLNGAEILPGGSEITLLSTDIFNNSISIDFGAAWDTISNFENLSSGDLSAMMNQVAAMLQSFGVDWLDLEIPGTGGSTLGDVIDLGEQFSTAVVDALDLLEQAEADPYGSLQLLAQALIDSGVAGTDAISYDAATNRVLVTLGFSAALPVGDDAPSVAIDLNYGDAIWGEFSTDATATISGDVAIALVLGLSLAPPPDGEDEASILERVLLGDASFEANIAADAAFNASAKIGGLSIELTDLDGDGTSDSNIHAEASINVSLAGGSAFTSLSDIFAGNYSIGTPVTSGSMDAHFGGITVDTGVFGVISGDPTIEISIPDINDLDNIDFDLSGFDEALAAFQNFEISDIFSGLSSITSIIDSFGGSEYLDLELPMINVSAREILTFVERFSDAMTAFEGTDGLSLESMESALNDVLTTAFDLPSVDDIVDIALDQVSKIFTFNLNHSYSVAYDDVPFNIDFTELLSGAAGGWEAMGQLVAGVEGSGNVSISASADLNLEFGFDLTTPTSPKFFIGDSSSLIGNLLASAENVDFSVALGPLGIFIVGGSAGIGLSHEDMASPAQLGVRMDTDAGDGRWYFDTENPLTRLDPFVNGHIHGDLPMYFPTEGNSIGSLAFEIEINPLSAELTEYPSLDDLLDGFSILDNVGAIIDGIDYLLTLLEEQIDGVLEQYDIPLIGNSLQDAVNAMSDLRSDIITPLTDFLEDVFTADAVTQALFQLLGSDGLDIDNDGIADIDGLNILGDANNDGVIDEADIGLEEVRNGADELIGYEWNPQLQRHIDIVDFSLASDLGLPGFDFSLEGDLVIGIDFAFTMGIGITVDDGVYIKTGAAEELALDISITTPGLDGAANALGFLALSVEDGDHNGNGQSTHASAGVAIDIDGGADGILKATELLSGGGTFNADFTGEIEIDLLMTLTAGSSGESISMPSITTNFLYLEDFTDESSRTLGFTDITMDFGEFISDFAGGILGDIKTLLEPLEPLRDALNYEIPILEVTLLDLVSVQYPSIGTFFEAMNDIYDLMDLVDSLNGSENWGVNLGSYAYTGSAIDLPTLGNAVFDDPNSSVNSQISGFGGTAADFGSQMETVEGGFSFPILDFGEAFSLFLGGTPTLFQYDMPTVEFDYEIVQSIPIWGFTIWNPFGDNVDVGVFFEFGGKFELKINLGFGYDALGLQNFAASDYSDYSTLLDGFFIADTRSGSSVDTPELIAKLTFFGAVKLDVWVASVDGGGALEGTIELDLVDPNNDGKIRGDEFASLYNSEGIWGLFDVSGKVRFYAYAEVTLIGLIDWNYEWLSFTLLEFGPDGTVDTLPEYTLAELDGSTLYLNMGTRADLRGEEGVDGSEDETFTLTGSGAGTVQVGYAGVLTTYTGVNQIVGDGAGGDDRIETSGLYNSLTFDGGSGSDYIEGSEVSDTLTGGSGNDTIYGFAGDDTISGGLGADVLYGGTAEDILYGYAANTAGDDNAADRMYGEENNDVIHGGGGDDYADGGSGDDTIYGYAGSDELHGGEDQDTIWGYFSNNSGDDGVADFLFGNAGNDTLYGQAGNDELDGEDGDDILFGGSGNDTLNGGGDDDVLSGQSGQDTLRGGGGNDELFGHAEDVSDDDGSADTLIGGGGNDTLMGQGGSDDLFGGNGNDTLYGHDLNTSSDDGAADSLSGEEGNDTLSGNMGADSLWGGNGADILYGHAQVTTDDDGAADTIWGGGGDDTISGNGGGDALHGGDNNDTIYGHALATGNDDGGIDVIHGDDGSDVLFGNAGADTLYGDAGDDVLSGNAGDDMLYGGTGDDVLSGNSGDDILNGEADSDTLYGHAADTSDDDAGRDVLHGDGGNDTLYGQAGDDELHGGDDDDALHGNGGNDTLAGDSGDDVLYGDAGEDSLQGNSDNDILYGGDDNDTLNGNGGNDQLYGNDGVDDLYGDAGDDTLSGNNGNDTLYGGTGKDTLSGNNGEDLLFGGSGNDTIDGNDGIDLIFGEDDDDTIYGSAGEDIIYGGLGNDVIEGNGDDDLIYGNEGNDTIHGNDGRDRLFGSEGDDVIYGGGGGDYIDGQAGNDTIEGNSGNDIIRGGDDNDTIYGGDPTGLSYGEDRIFGDAGDDLISGGNGNDWISGGEGADTIYGGQGHDVLAGDAGDDMIEGNLGSDRIDGGDGNDLLMGEGDVTRYVIPGLAVSYYAIGDVAAIPNFNNMTPFFQDTIGNINEELSYGNVFGSGMSDKVGVRIHGYIQIDVPGTKTFVLSSDDGSKLYIDGELLIDNDGTHETVTLQGDIDLGLGLHEIRIDYFERTGSHELRLAWMLDQGTWDIIPSNLFFQESAVEGDDDFIVGGDGDDTILGDLGNDLLAGDAGNDTLNGGDGDDILLGGDGDDTLFGSTGEDLLDGGSGTDHLEGGLDNDELRAGTGTNDDLDGGAGDDLIYGSHYGDDKIDGGSGNDTVFAQGGNDTVFGGDGDDTLDGGEDADALHGGDGNDVIFGGGGVGDQLFGEAGDDVLHGSDDGADSADGGEGSDHIYGNGGNDFLYGNNGDDVIEGGFGDDTIMGNAGTDVLIGGADHDLIFGFDDNPSDNNLEIDYLYGDYGTNIDDPFSGGDQLFGNGGNDILVGEGGDDYIYHGGGSENIIDYGSGETANPDDFVPPAPTPNPTVIVKEAITFATTQLAEGMEGRSRWSGLSGADLSGGIANTTVFASEPALAVASDGTVYAAWIDLRSGSRQVYVAEYSGGSWNELGGSTTGGGVSNTIDDARDVSISVTNAGNPIVTWTQTSGPFTDIYSSEYNETTTSWNQLVVDNSGVASDSQITEFGTTNAAAWLDDSSGTVQLYIRQLVGGVWQSIGAGSDNAGGVSNAVKDVNSFTLAGNGTEIVLTWETNGSIFLMQWDGAAWIELAGSASGDGLAGTTAAASNPTVAMLGSDVTVAWLAGVDAPNSVYGTHYTSGVWSDLKSGNALSSETIEAHSVHLASSNSGVMEMDILWTARDLDASEVIERQRWNGSKFVTDLASDMTTGIVGSAAAVADVSYVIDGDGHAIAAIQNGDGSAMAVRVIANKVDIATTHELALGSSIQTLLDSGTLQDGDVIVLEAGAWNESLALTSTHNGVHVIATGANLVGDITLDGADNVVFDALQVTGTLSADNTTDLTLRDVVVSGVTTLTGGSGALLDGGVFGGVVLNGNVDGVEIRRTTLQGATSLTLDATTNLLVHDVMMTPTNLGIDVQSSWSGTIANNTINGGDTGINIDAAFTGVVEHNEIENATVGVAYNASATLRNNTIHSNTTGVTVSVYDESAAFGFVGESAPNTIANNQVGVALSNGRIIGQIITQNDVGIAGTGIAGHINIDNANVIDGNVVGVDMNGIVQRNRFVENITGVLATDELQVVQNIFLNHASVAINVQQVDGVHIVGNTMYEPNADGIRVISTSNGTRIFNNIVWVESGYALYVASDSVNEFASDYNTLHASGTGTVLFWSREYTDLLEFQAEVAGDEMHSIGLSEIDEAWSQPQFANRGSGDLRLLGAAAGVRFTSPAVDSADPSMDLGRLDQTTNLLANGSFENGLTDWDYSADAGTDSSESAFDGSLYFTSGSDATSYAQQTIDLVAAGYSTGQLDSGMMLDFGGRMRTADGDVGSVTLTVYDAVGQEIFIPDLNGAMQIARVVEADGTITTWEGVRDRFRLPVGSRSVQIRFEGTRVEGTPNDVIFDNAFVTLSVDSALTDQGAFGNSPEDQTRGAAAPKIVLRSPDMYLDWGLELPRVITWDSIGNTSGLPVKIDLIQDTVEGPVVVASIAGATPDDGIFDQSGDPLETWWPLLSGIAPGTEGLRLQITINGDVLSMDRSRESFVTPIVGTEYYVDDASNTLDQYTVGAIGNVRNSGKTPDAPKPHISTLLRAYELRYGDIVYVDAGEYGLIQPIVISAVDGVGFGNDYGFSIVGPSIAGSVAKVSPLTTEIENNEVLFTIDRANDIKLSNVSFTGGYYGVEIISSDGIQLDNIVAYENADDGLHIDNASMNTSIIGGEYYANGGNGIWIESSSSIDGVEIYSNNENGLHANNTSTFTEGKVISLTNSTIYNNTLRSVYMYASSNPEDGWFGVVATGNTVYHTDMESSYDVFYIRNGLLDGNDISGGSVGLNVTANSLVQNNIIHESSDKGAYVQHGTTFMNNRVWGHDNYGVLVASPTNMKVTGNKIYNNAIGIRTSASNSSVHVRNNMIYLNTTAGMQVYGGSNAIIDITNNTFLQHEGRLVDVAGNSENVVLRNNIFLLDDGYGIYVGDANQVGFDSDYNLFDLSGSAIAGYWQGDQTDITDWQLASSQDAHLVLGYPDFVSLVGIDGTMGASGGVDYGEDDDFHLKSGSIAINQGDPNTWWILEEGNNGNRVNLGAFGNTSEATEGDAQVVQVLSPNGNERLELDSPTEVLWLTAGLGEWDLLGMINAGGEEAGNRWLEDAHYENYYNTTSTTQTIDVSTVTDAAPESVYQTQRYGSTAEPLSYYIPVVDGSYRMRVHWAELSAVDSGQRVMDIVVNGSLVANNIDVYDAVGRYAAFDVEFDAVAFWGSGLTIEIETQTSWYPFISGLEIYKVAGGVESPKASVQWSTDGGSTYDVIGGSVFIDRFGMGETSWTPDVATEAGVIKVTELSSGVSDTSDGMFSVLTPSTEYFINDASTSFDVYTTAVGNDANDGRSAAAPMASLSALLAAYDFGLGDTIYVDTGTYALTGNIVIDSDDAGVTIIGAAGSESATSDSVSILDRGNSGVEQYVFDIQNADNLTISHLSISGAYHGINVSNSDSIVLNELSVYNNIKNGLQIDDLSDNFIITGGSYFSNIDNGMYIRGYGDISGVTVYENSDNGIQVENYSDVTELKTVVVTASTIYNNGGRNLYLYSTDAPEQGWFGIEATYNTVYMTDGAGVYYESIYSRNALIEMNDVSGGSEGIDARGNSVVNENVIHGTSVRGLYLADTAIATGNRIWGNLDIGLFATGSSVYSVSGNMVYQNDVGIHVSLGGSSEKIANNVVYNNVVAGIRVDGNNSSVLTVENNTIIQQTGRAIDVMGSTENFVLRNNIIIVNGGFGIYVDDNSQSGFDSNYNLIEVAGGANAGYWQGNVESIEEWRSASSQDANSIVGDPQFVLPEGADGLLGVVEGVDYGADDNFHLQSGSIAIDQGGLHTWWIYELGNNGNRANLGAFGNTNEATESAAQLVQVLTPNGGDLLELDVPTEVTWVTAGLGEWDLLGLINVGGENAENRWLYDAFYADNYYSTSTNEVIDTSGVSDAAPQSVYQTQNYGSGTESVSYFLPVEDGTYHVRLHWAELDNVASGYRVMDVYAQESLVLSDIDVFDAVGRFAAYAAEFEIDVVGGSNLLIEIATQTAWRSFLSGIELYKVASGVPSPTADVLVSENGGATWSTVVQGTSIDRFGMGAATWTPANATENGLLQIMGVESGTSDQSDATFSVLAPSTEYYINDGSTDFDVYTSAIGEASNDGRSAVTPMASLSALLAAYDFDLGDTIYVDSGTYALTGNIVIDSDDAGVTIIGAAASESATENSVSLFDRGNSSSGQNVIEIDNADEVTLSHLSITGGYEGIHGNFATALTLNELQVYANAYRGVSLNASSADLTITGGSFYNNTNDGIYTESSATISFVNVYENGDEGIELYHQSSTPELDRWGDVTNTTVYNNNGDGIYVRGYASYESGLVISVHDNEVYDNTSRGLYLYTSTDPVGNWFQVVARDNVVSNSDLNSYYEVVYARGALVQNNDISGGSESLDAYADSLIIDNVIHESGTRGVYLRDSAVLVDNRIWGHNGYGVITSGGEVSIESNQIYNNTIGVHGYLNYSPITIANNIVYNNTQVGIQLDGSSNANPIVIQNTLYQTTGRAIDVVGNSENILLRNNIMIIEGGYGIYVDNDSQTSFNSDYNLITVSDGAYAGYWQGSRVTLSDWQAASVQDAHSIVGDPQFVLPAGDDGLLGVVEGVDYGADDNFHLQSGSIAVDQGDPNSWWIYEEGANGNRANLGAYGNTSEATQSSAEVVQLLSPNGGERFELDVVTDVTLQTAGLGEWDLLGLINAGGEASGNRWLEDAFYENYYNTTDTQESIDLSGVVDAAPESVYQAMRQGDTTTPLSYYMPVIDGTYRIRLHWAELSYVSAGSRVMDVFAQGGIVVGDIDVFAAVGQYAAYAVEFDITVTDNQGISLEIGTQTSWRPFVSGIELYKVATGATNPTLNLSLSNDGGAWETMAENISIDRYGSATTTWVPVSLTDAGLLQATHVLGGVSDVSDAAFRVLASSTEFYVNDASLANDVYTSAVGNNVNDGHTVATPMASLAALLAVYDLGAGDTVYVDTGVYDVTSNILVLQGDAGVTIIGASASSSASDMTVTTFDRSNGETGQFVIELNNTDDVTISGVSLIGGYYGLYLEAATNVILVDLDVQGNSFDGLFADSMSSDLTLETGAYHDNGNDGVHVESSATVQGVSAYNNVKYGLDIYHSWSTTDNDRWAVISNNTVYGNSDTGVRARSWSDSTNGLVMYVTDNNVYNNGYREMYLSAGTTPTNDWFGLVASANTVSTGTDSYYESTYLFNSLFTGNDVGGGSEGIEANGNSVVRDNVIHESAGRGLYVRSGSIATGNRIWGHANEGIWSQSNNTLIEGNVVYGNAVGIHGVMTYTPVMIRSNVVYGNTDAGIRIDGSTYEGYTVSNNTIYQTTGRAIDVLGDTQNLILRNNIIVAEGGYGIYVDDDSQVGFDSDYNLFTIAGSASAGYWSGDQTDLASWTAAANSQDIYSIAGDPQFVSITGADGIMGVLEGVDHGRDDNFQVLAGSVAIDSGDQWAAPMTDFFGRARFDDVGTVNTGSDIYNETQLGSSDWAAVGDAMNWRSVNSSWTLDFAEDFIFPFAGESWTSVRVSSNGFLQFGEYSDASDFDNSAEAMSEYIRIAPLWDNLRTNLTGDDIFVDQSVGGEVTIRWDASLNEDQSDVHIAVTLYSDGQFTFHYGAGNAGLTPTVGYSSGDYGYYNLSMYDGVADLANVDSVHFGLVAGYADIGAFEFTGDSNDTTPPTIIGTDPSGIHDGTVIGGGVNEIVVTFSEQLDAIEAAAAGNYDLRNSGDNGVFGDGDDDVISLVPIYVIGESTVMLQLSDPVLEGDYRLTIYGNSGRALRDLAGNKLDGDGDGIAGGDYQRFFEVDTAPAITDVTFNNGLEQRSNTSLIELTFDEATNIDVLIANGSILDAVQLVRTTHGGGTVKLTTAHFAWNKATNTISIDLTNDGFGGSGETMLSDARYALHIDTTMITDSAGNVMEDTDGTQDGTLVIDRSSNAESQDLFRLAGDANGDAVVNEIDLAILQAAYLFAPNSDEWDENADLNGDGTINVFDAWLLAWNYGNDLDE